MKQIYFLFKQQQDQIIDFYLNRDQNQRHVYTFDDNVIKASIIRDKNELKNKESICEVKKQKMKLKTLFKGVFSLDEDSDVDSIKEEKQKIVLFKKYKNYLVIVRRYGDIIIYQMQDDKLILISYTNTNQLSKSVNMIFLDVIYFLNLHLTTFTMTNSEKHTSNIPQKSLFINQLINIILQNISKQKQYIIRRDENKLKYCIKIYSLYQYFLIQIKAYLQEDFLYILCETKKEYLLRAYLLVNPEKIKNVYENPEPLYEKQQSQKMLGWKVQGDFIYTLSTYFLFQVFQIDSIDKKPRDLKKIFICNMLQPHNFDLDSQKVYMVDEEKGVYEFQLTDIHQHSNKTEFCLKGESLYNKSKAGRVIVKPFQDEKYFVIIGKQSNRNYLAEMLNDSSVSTSDDEPYIKKIYFNKKYIFFITEDNIHILYRNLDEQIVKSSEKQYTFEVIGVQDLHLDENNNDLFYVVTQNKIIHFSVDKIQSQVSCYYNQRSEIQEDKLNKYMIQYISNKCSDNSTMYCQHEIEVNAHIGYTISGSDTESFLIGLIFGVVLIFIIIILYFLRSKKYQKIQKYNSFHNEMVQEVEQSEQSSNQKV